RDESIAFYDGDVTMSGVRREDASEGRSTNGAVNFGSGGHTLCNAASGDLFGNGRSVAVTASIKNNDPWLRIWDTDAQGDPFVTLEGRISTSNASEIELACADFDGDGRDEVAAAVHFASSTFAYVFDDAIDGNWSSGGNLTRLWTGTPQINDWLTEDGLICGAQLDEDDAFEIVWHWRRNSGKLLIHDDLASGGALLDEVTVGATSSGPSEPSLQTVRLDASGPDAILFGNRTAVTTYAVDLSGPTVTQLATLVVPTNTFGDVVEVITSRPCPIDDDGDGVDDLLFVQADRIEQGGFPFGFPTNLTEIRTRIYEWRPSSTSFWADIYEDQVDMFMGGFSSNIGPVDIAVVALDEDLDGEEEYRALVGLNYGFSSDDGPIREAYAFGGELRDVDYRLQRQVPQSFGAGTQSIALVAGDDDGESTVLRWTGDKETVLSPPIPIVVMEAVPTRAGVGQNVDGSSTQFTTGNGASQSVSTRVGVSASLMGGVTTPDLFGVAEARATATLSAEIARTTGTTETVRTFVTQTSGADEHAVVFQGTLFRQYHYEVLSAQDPSAVGSIYAINVPVATEQWRWPLGIYNLVFPSRAIDPAVVFGNSGGATVIGDPSTYATEAELTSLVSGPGAPYVGWVGADANVGQGTTGSTTFGLEISTVNATADELTTSVELGAEFKVGGNLFGASVGLSNSWLYEVETSADATFSGTIGDLPTSSYFAHQYAAGVVVYEDDTSSILPFRVIRFWTDPIGTSYP
ncbi:MAG: hypothetical protein AAFP86_08660, partial [Planctomycetota bacterium]